MRPALIAFAALAAPAAAVLFVTRVRGIVASRPLPKELAPDPEHAPGPTVRALLLPAAPIAAFAVVGLAIGLRHLFGPPEGAIVALLMMAAAMAMVLPTLCSELLLRTHNPERMDPEREARAVACLRRAGAVVNEVWVSSHPVGIFWRPNLCVPAVLVGHRALVWERALTDATDGPGLALGTVDARFWPWALWPLVAAAMSRSNNPLSPIPWWLLAAVAGFIAVVALPWGLRAVKVRERLRSDAGARDEIRGALALALLEARLGLSRNGTLARFSAQWAWIRALNRAYGAARVARLTDADVDALVTSLRTARRPSGETSGFPVGSRG